MNPSTALAARRSTRVLSTEVRDAAERRTKSAPLIVTGITPGKLVTIQPSQFSKLDVDPTYQRGETSMVAEIIRVLQAGGQVLDPVSLCRRPWDSDTSRLWIVDGYQRVCAFQQLSQPFQAVVYDSDSIDAEKRFFVSLNARKAVSADLIVKSWTGPAGDFIRSANENQQHPLYGRVHMEQGRNKVRLGGVIIARAALAAATGMEPKGEARAVLARLDHALKESKANRARAEHMLRLLPLVFTSNMPQMSAVIAVAHVAHERWKDEIIMPKAGVIDKLRLIRWNEQVPSMTKKYRPVLVELIRKAWR